MDGQLDAVAQAIVSAILVNAGSPRMSDDALVEHAQAVAALPAERRERVAEELVAMAKRLWDTGQDAWQDALVQLSALVAVAVGGLDAAVGALAESVGADKARALVGAVSSLLPVGKPVGGDRPAGSVSPLAALLANKSDKKPRGHS